MKTTAPNLYLFQFHFDLSTRLHFDLKVFCSVLFLNEILSEVMVLVLAFPLALLYHRLFHTLKKKRY